jgi:hypothetical protein
MSDPTNLPILRVRMMKYVYKSQSTTGYRQKNAFKHASGPGIDEWTPKKIWNLAKLPWQDLLPFLEGRYEAMFIDRNKIDRLRRLMDRIESGMISLVNGEVVETIEATRKPDAIHKVAFLLSGRPILRLSTSPALPAKTLRNPFKKG